MTATFPAITVLSGTIADASGQPASGTITAVPVALYGTQAKPVTVTDASGLVVVAPSGVRRRFDASSGGTFSMPLAATDTAGLAPANWAYQFTLDAGSQGTAETFTALLPGSPATADFSNLIPTTPGSPSTTYLPQTGGTLSGTLTLGGSPPLRVTTGAVAGDILTSDSSGNATWKQPPAFSPMAYGAAGNGTTDDTTAVLAAFTAASAVAGVVDLGHYRFLTSSPVPVYSGLHVKGNAWAGGQAGIGGGALINNSSDLFLWTANSTNHASFTDITFEDCWLYSGTGGGHIWNAGGKLHTGCTYSSGSHTVTDPGASTADIGSYVQGNGNWTNGLITAAVNGVSYTVSGTATNNGSGVAVTIGACNMSNVKILDVQATQTNNSKGIFYQVGGTYIGCIADRRCVFTGPSGATISPWYQYGVDIATISFGKMNANGSGATAVPFFTIDFGVFNGTMDTIVFGDIVFEVCNGGCIYVGAATNITLDDCADWDVVTYTNHAYQFRASANGYNCSLITVRHSWAPVSGGYYSVYADSGTGEITLDSCGQFGTAITYSTPAAQTRIINCFGLTDTFPALSVAGAPVASANDPLSLGFCSTIERFPGGGAALAPSSGFVYWMRLISGGYAMSNINLFVTTSSGNLRVGYYPKSGSGNTAKPGTLGVSSVLTAMTSLQMAIPLSGSVTPSIGDYFAIYIDNTTARIYGSTNGGFSQTLAVPFEFRQGSLSDLPANGSGAGYCSAAFPFYAYGT